MGYKGAECQPLSSPAESGFGCCPNYHVKNVIFLGEQVVKGLWDDVRDQDYKIIQRTMLLSLLWTELTFKITSIRDIFFTLLRES